MSLFILLLSKITLLWGVFFILALALHIVRKDYYTLSIAIGAGLTLVVQWVGNIGILFQILTFVVTTLVFLASFIPLIIQKQDRQQMRSQIPDFPERDKQATVVQTIDNMAAEGRVSLDGKEYKARSADGNVLDKDSLVRVIDRDREILIVH